MKRVATIERHCAGGWRLERAEDIQERTLAAAGRPHDCGCIARRERKRHVGQDLERTARCRVLFAQCSDLKHNDLGIRGSKGSPGLNLLDLLNLLNLLSN